MPLADRWRRIVTDAGSKARLEDPEWLRHQYVEQVLAPSSIAESLSVSTAEVVAALESFGVDTATGPSGTHRVGPTQRVRRW